LHSERTSIQTMLGRTSRFASSRVTQRSARVDWSPCYTAYSPQALRDALGGLDRRLTASKSITNAAPKSVPEIDFDKYVTAGVDADVVAKLKAAYEAKTFPVANVASEAKGFNSFVDYFKAQVLPKIAEKQETKQLLLKSKAEHQEDFLTKEDWTLFDWERVHPGLVRASQRKKDLDLIFPIDEHTYPLDNIDMGAVRDKLKAGKVVTELDNIPVESFLYTFDTVKSAPIGDYTGPDWANVYDQMVLPGTPQAEKKWLAEWGPIWGKLAAV